MNLEIRNPCPENWNKMTPDTKGRFCSTCAKSVHDFTGKPKEELLSFLLCSTQSPCVRMLASQEKFTPEEVQLTAQKIIRSGKVIPAAAMALVMLLAAGCNTGSEQNAALTKTDTVLAARALPWPVDTPVVCAHPPQDSLREVMGDIDIKAISPDEHAGMIMGKIAKPEPIVVPPPPEPPMVLGEPAIMGAPPMPSAGKPEKGDAPTSSVPSTK